MRSGADELRELAVLKALEKAIRDLNRQLRAMRRRDRELQDEDDDD